MSDQIGLNGAVSAEPSQLLHAVESRLNELGTGVLAQIDAQAQTASAASTAQPSDPLSKDGSAGSNGGGVGVIVLTAVVAGAVGYLVGKKHKKKGKGPIMEKVKSPNP
jgi:uncharacterized protein HemX